MSDAPGWTPTPLQRLSNVLGLIRGKLVLFALLRADPKGVVEPNTDPAWWDEQQCEMNGALLSARMMADWSAPLLAQVPNCAELVFELRVLIGDLSREWPPLLRPGPPELLEVQTLNDLHRRLERVAERIRVAASMPEVVPLVADREPQVAAGSAQPDYVKVSYLLGKNGREQHVLLERMRGEVSLLKAEVSGQSLVRLFRAVEQLSRGTQRHELVPWRDIECEFHAASDWKGRLPSLKTIKDYARRIKRRLAETSLSDAWSQKPEQGARFGL